MIMQTELRVIERSLSLLSRTGVFALDWDPVTKSAR